MTVEEDPATHGAAVLQIAASHPAIGPGHRPSVARKRIGRRQPMM